MKQCFVVFLIKKKKDVANKVLSNFNICGFVITHIVYS